MPRRETQLDRIEKGVSDLTLTVNGDNASGKIGLAELVRRHEEKLNPPIWRHVLREAKTILVAAGATVGIHTGMPK